MAFELEVQDDSGESGLLRQVRSEAQRLLRYKRWLDQSERADDPWRADVIENRRFLSNDQWDEGDVTRLRAQRRPMLTINKVLPRVLFLKGIQASQQEEPSILPFDGGDARSAELMQALYKWFATKTREQRIDSKVFDHKIVAGLGFWKISWNFDQDPEGALSIEAPDPLCLFIDPNWLDADWNAAMYCIQATWMDPEEAIDLWPEHADEIERDVGEWLNAGMSAHGGMGMGAGDFAGDSMSSDRSFWDPQTQRLRVLEVWYKQRVSVDAVLFLETGETSVDPERIAAIQQAILLQPELMASFEFIRQPVTKVFVAHCSENILLDDQPSPYADDCLPFFPTIGYYWWKAPFGIVTPMKDLQREKNRRRSTVAEMIGRAALSGFFNHETQGADSEHLEKYAAGVAKVIPYKGVVPEAIQPPQLPQAIQFMDAASDRDMGEVSNIHAELLGTSTQRTVSGKAIKARQQSGLIVQEPMLKSFREDKEPAVKFALCLIRQFCSVPRAARILGTIALRAPQGPMAQMQQAMSMMELRELLQGSFDQDYDVVIAAKPYDPSLQQQKLEKIMELLGQFAAYVPPQVVVSALQGAGVLTEDEAQQTLAYAQQRIAADQQQQMAATAGQAPAPPNRQAAA